MRKQKKGGWGWFALMSLYNLTLLLLIRVISLSKKKDLLNFYFQAFVVDNIYVTFNLHAP